jgi:hypothetical protein
MKHLSVLFLLIIACTLAARPVAWAQGADRNVGISVMEPRISVTPMTVDFGTMEVGSIKDELVVVKNIGTTEMTLGRGVIENDTAKVFSVVGVGANLLPGESYHYRVRCGLIQVGELEAWLAFSSNDTTFKPRVYVHLIVNAVLSARGDSPLSPGACELLGPFPNPATGSITLQVRGATQGRAALRVVDAQGRLWAVPFEGELAPGEHVVTFDASALPPGAYYCVLRTRERTMMKSLLIVR